jgi:hypothetical protein
MTQTRVWVVQRALHDVTRTGLLPLHGLHDGHPLRGHAPDSGCPSTRRKATCAGSRSPTTPPTSADPKSTGVPNAGCTLKDGYLWAGTHDTTARAGRAVKVFPHTYNYEWLIERHGYRTPREAYLDAAHSEAA